MTFKDITVQQQVETQMQIHREGNSRTFPRDFYIKL